MKKVFFVLLWAALCLHVLAGVCAGLLDEGDELIESDQQERNTIMLVRKADGTKRIRIADSSGAVVETGPVPEDASLDVYHMVDGTLYLGNDRCYFNFKLARDGKWYLDSVQAEDMFGVNRFGVVDFGENPTQWRNNGVIYGEHPWSGEITSLDLLALPRTLEEALASTDTSRYALVNNPNPDDRLHLRVMPDKSAASLGKFYNRTPVYVLEEQGDWVHVRVGCEDGGLEGYMMKRYLAFGSEKNGVACAFPQLFALEGQDSVPLLARPEKGADSKGEAPAGEFYIIGVYGDDWFIVITDEGVVGYAPCDQFWEGNG